MNPAGIASVNKWNKDMIIRTRYSIGEQVWFMRENKVHCAKVTGIEYSAHSKWHSLAYQLEGYDAGLNPVKFPENTLFISKQELIESL